MELITSLKSLLASISVAILTIFGVQTPPQTSQNAPETPIVQIATTTTETPTVTSTTPKNDPVVDAYELGKAVGRIEGQLDVLEKQVPTTTPMTNPVPAPAIVPTAPAPVAEPTSPAPQPEQPLPPQPKPSMAEIKIINPTPGKGLGRTYTAQPEIVDESNYIVIGLLVRDDNGNPVKDATVTVVATDSEQNKTLDGTGNVTKIYTNGNPETLHYYPFTYQFKTAGTHTITFTANGMTETATVEVGAADPA